MTSDRWRRIDDLFQAALRLAPSERADWVRAACADDAELRAELTRLLEQDEKADRDGFLSPREPEPGRLDATGSWQPRIDRHSLIETGPADQLGAFSIDATGEFTPNTAIRAETGSHSSAWAMPPAQQRLRGLSILYLFIAGLMLFWKYAIVRDPEPMHAIPYALLLAILGGFVSLLSRPWPLSPALLKALELGLIGSVAVVFAVAQYQALLDFSLLHDAARAQVVMRNRAFVTAVLILSYGIQVPASRRSAALVVGSLAVLPFATLLWLHVRHPEATAWLGGAGPERRSTPLALIGFDAMLLLILAAGTVFGARTMSRLRRPNIEVRPFGPYRLRRRLGAGGMGEVYLAEHQLLRRPCALKLLRLGPESGPKALEQFEREVRLTATLSHPNTVEVYDYGRTEDGTLYYVMEYLPGLSLQDLVDRYGPLPPGRTVYLLRQVCQALREAHAAGLIHRDIKPSNIFAARRGGRDDVAKLFDFGLVLPLTRSNAPAASGEGWIFGTPMFMSPEQARGDRELDERSDLYSLGAVAYYLLAGRPPFDGENGVGLLIAHARDPVVPPSQFRAGIPADLERVVLRCLAKGAAERFADAESLELALSECACAGDWDQDCAARWWRNAGQVLATKMT